MSTVKVYFEGIGYQEVLAQYESEDPCLRGIRSSPYSLKPVIDSTRWYVMETVAPDKEGCRFFAVRQPTE